MEKNDCENCEFVKRLFPGSSAENEKKLAKLNELILNSNRWAWVRETMFNAAKWITAIGAAIVAVKLGVLDLISRAKP